MLVGDICSRDVVSIAAGVDLVNAANVMRTRHVGLLVVTADGSERGAPIGVLTDRDVVIEVVSKGVDPTQVKVEDAMSRDPVTTGVDERPEHALQNMRASGVRRMPVVDAHGKLDGVLSLDDPLHWVASALSDAAGVVRREQRVERRLPA